MSRNQNILNSGPKSFNISLDVKNFSKNQKNCSMFKTNKQIQLSSSKQIRIKNKNSQSFLESYTNSQKNIINKKRRLSITKAIKIEDSISINQHLFDLKYTKAQKYLNSNNYHQAIPILQSLIAFHIDTPLKKQIYFWLAICHNKQSNVNQSINILTQALNQFSNFEDGYLYRGKLYCKIKKYKEALKDFLIALNQNHQNSNTYLDLGQCYILLGNRKQGHRVWKQGRQKSQNNSIFYIKIVQNLIQMKQMSEVEQQMKQLRQKISIISSERLYIEGLLQKSRNNLNQACIFFQQSIKFNNSHKYVSQSLHQLIKIKIIQRDYYSAYHCISRVEFLKIKSPNILCFIEFLQGVILIMKKKFQDGIIILNRSLSKKKILDQFLLPLHYKFLAYAYFKVGKYLDAIRQYQKLPNQEIDIVSKYNSLLVQGIIKVDISSDYKGGISKFNQSKLIFNQKVQPYNYVAMTIIKQSFHQPLIQEQNRILSVIKALDQLASGEKINCSNSNLLFHRTFIHLYMENWEMAIADINKCIQKAEENLPKYFYIRGICYAAIKQLSKAINQQSICISLNPDYADAYLERAKNNFLIGDTESGFKDLKVYMNYNPHDLKVHMWIGDLLYEGKSYKDALRAYQQIGEKQFLQLLQMKAKCLFRVGTLNQVMNQLKKAEKMALSNESNNKDKNIFVDQCAIKLLNTLIKDQSATNINQQMKILNSFLEDGKVGYIFQLIDCMNLIAVSSFYLGQYDDAYQSFALVLELFESLQLKQGPQLKSECSQQHFNLQIDKIIFHMFLCQVLRGQRNKAINLLKDQQVMSSYMQYDFGKQIIKIVEQLKLDKQSLLILQPNDSRSIFKKFRKVQIRLYKLKIQARLFFGLFHQPANNLYSTQFAKQLICRLRPSYIDNMPQGPWIKRNQHGVIFTQDLMIQQNSEIFGSLVSDRKQQIQENLYPNQIKNKQQLIHSLKLDKKIQDKLNTYLKKKKQ